MIDSHCHLDPQYFDADRADVLARARAAGVEAFVCVGVGGGLAAPREAAALAATEPDVFATVGVHPHDVAAMNEADWPALEELARQPRVVGIGETGLDYYYDHSPRAQQQAAYRRFIAMASAARLPVVSHIRDAHDDAAAILRDARAGDGVIHCFSGGVAEVRAYLDLGQHLSFSGILTFKNAGNVREAATFAPLDRILIETDAPYLAPAPHRGHKNEPAFIVETLAALASLRGIPTAEVDAATTANARRLFGLPSPSRSADTRLVFVSSTQPVRIRLRYASFDAFIDKFAPNVTRGGVFIASRTPLPIGSTFAFEIQLAGGEVALAGDGKVTWVKAFDAAAPQRPHGMGVQFLRLDSPSRELLNKILSRKAAPGGSGAVRAPAAVAASGPHRAGMNGTAQPRVDTNVDLASEFGVDEARLRRAVDRNWVGAKGAGEIDEIEKLLKPDPVEPVSIAQALADLPRLLDPAARRGRMSGAVRPLGGGKPEEPR